MSSPRKVGFILEINGAKETIDRIAELELQLGDVTTQLREAKKAGDQDLYKKLRGDSANLRQEIKDLNSELRDQVKQFKDAKFPEDSYRALNLQLIEAKKEIKALSKAELEAGKGDALRDKIQRLSTELKEFDQELGDNFRNVGNYEEDINKALDGFSEKNTANLKGLVQELAGVSPNAQKAASGIEGLSAGFKAVAANPLVAVLALLAASLSAIYKAFTRTERGANILAKASSVLQGIFSEFVGIVDSAVTSLLDFVNDPISGIEDLGNAIVNRLVNSFSGFIELVGLGGKALGQLINRDFKGLKQTVGEAASALTQFATGLDADQQNELADSIRDTRREIQNNIDAWAKLGESRRSIFKQNIELTKSLEGVTTNEALLSSIADDTTKSFAEREKAAQAARLAAEERAEIELRIAKNNLSLVEQEIRLRKANGEAVDNLLEQQLSAFQALKGAERDLTLTIRDNEKVRAELKQDRLERDLDILIDGFDNQKAINERLIQDDKKTLEERQRLLEETRELADASFKRQIETIQEFTNVAVNANELLSESDAVRLNKQIRSLGLSEVIEGRLLEVIRDRRTAIQDLSETQQELSDEAIELGISAPIGEIEAARDLQIAALLQIGQTAEELADERKVIEATANKAILEQRLQDERLSNQERAALELELQEEIRRVQKASNQQQVNEAISAIRKERGERIRALLDREGDEKEASDKIAAIELESDLRILQTRLDLEKLSADERIDLELRIQKLREGINAQTNEQILKTQREQFAETQLQLQNIGSVANVLSIANEAREESQIAKIEERYARQLELAQGNEEQIKKIEARRDAEVAKVQKEAFERQKKLQIAQALVSAAQAIVSTLAAVPGPVDILSLGAARAIQIALVGATAVAQVTKIRAQKFAQGGLVEPTDLSNTTGPIATRQNVPRQPSGDNVLAYVKRGEVILNKKQQSALQSLYGGDVFRKIGVPGFNEGGLIGGDPQLINPNVAFSNPAPSTTEVVLSSEQIVVLANVLSKSIGQAVEKSTVKGAIIGADEAARLRERVNLTNQQNEQ
ncbi:MAG: hypothetical protein MRY78_10595 [Saprospiraceae bacterium]|nr:hypothetical protein [Saprospiraceae bacterium]